MYIIVSYDISTTDSAGETRLRRVAKTCLDYGQRVQNSVFECLVEPAQYVELRAKLLSIINTQTDSIRLYNLGKNWQPRIENHGRSLAVNLEMPLIV